MIDKSKIQPGRRLTCDDGTVSRVTETTLDTITFLDESSGVTYRWSPAEFARQHSDTGLPEDPRPLPPAVPAPPEPPAPRPEPTGLTEAQVTTLRAFLLGQKNEAALDFLAGLERAGR